MTASPDEHVVRRFIEGLARGDLETIGDVLSDDVVLHHAGRHAASGIYKGKYEVVALWLGSLVEMLGRSLHIDVHDITLSPGHAVEISKASATRAGVHFEWPLLRVYHLREGRITEVWVYDTDPYAVDVFLAENG